MPAVSTIFGTGRLHFLLVFGLSCAISTAVSAADIADAYKLFKSGQYDECARISQQAIEEGKFSESWRIIKIRADLARGEYGQALDTLDKALGRFRTSIRLRWWGYQVCQYNGRLQRATDLLNEIDELTDGSTWRYSDPGSRVTLGRFYLQRGVDPKEVLDGVYTQLKKRSPRSVEPYIAAGELALEKHDYELAVQQFEPALKMDGTDADIYFGLARAHAASDLAKTQQYLESALARNPKHVDSLLFIADSHIDSERYADAAQILRRVLAINVREPRAWAYLAVLSHLRGDPVSERICRDTGLLWWKRNPAIDALIGTKLSQKYRFAEGAAYQRQAMVIDPEYLPAQIQLSQDLLRLGQEEEGWQLAERVYNRDGYNVVAHNLVTLQDNLADFRTLVEGRFVVKMDAREAEIYGGRVLALLAEAEERLCDKYAVRIDKPVLVEIFPRQQDFAIRTFGLPGGAGFLGVCFGNVITANSPASQASSPANWQSVLWHEFCHVVTLNKTRNKMPRWLSEGISVYEEKQRNPTWGQSMTPAYRELILGDGLVPVSQLSAAFLNPPSPIHLQFAYYESSLVVEYLIREYGLETLQRVLVDLGAGMPINESLHRYAGSLELLDAEFADFARRRATELAPQLDWEQPEMPRRADVAELYRLLDAHPDNFWVLQSLAARLMAAEDWEAAKAPLQRLLELYPQHIGPDSAYRQLATVHRKLGETNQELMVLNGLAERSHNAVDAYLRLIELSESQGDWAAASRNAERVLAVNPLLPAPHRLLAKTAEQSGDDDRAAKALRVMTLMDPLDPADIHYRLARILQRQGNLESAKRHALRSLEDAPRFRAAHRILLDLRREIGENSEDVP